MGTSTRGFASMTPEERQAAGSKGGKRTASTHDMRKIGQMGGEKTKERGRTYFQEIGRKGGAAGKRGPAKIELDE